MKVAGRYKTVSLDHCEHPVAAIAAVLMTNPSLPKLMLYIQILGNDGALALSITSCCMTLWSALQLSVDLPVLGEAVVAEIIGLACFRMKCCIGRW